MDTKSKKFSRTPGVKAVLLILYIVCFAAMGAVTGYGAAYGNWVDLSDALVTFISDDPSSCYYNVRDISAEEFDEHRLMAEEAATAAPKTNIGAAVNKLPFYCRLEFSDGTEYANSAEPYFTHRYAYAVRDGNNEIVDTVTIEFGMSESTYNSVYDNWFIVRYNITVILVTDICLLIAGIILACVICRVSGEKSDGTVTFHPFFRVFYEISTAAVLALAVLVFAVIDADIHWLNELADFSRTGREIYMAFSGMAAAALALVLLYLAVCAQVRSKNHVFNEGCLIFRVLRLAWRVLKRVGKLFADFFRLIKEIFTGELYKAPSAAKKFLWIDCAFILASAVCFILFMVSDGFWFWVFLWLVTAGVFFFGRYKVIRDGAVLERQISEIYDGNYAYEATLSKNSPYTGSSERLRSLANRYQKGLEESVKAERMKIDLVTNVSHDLKTPLTSIISYVELLSKEELTPEAADYVKILQQKSERLKNIVADVFELAKTTSGEIAVAREQLDLTKLSYQTLAEMEDKINKYGFEVRHKICEPPVSVIGDGKRIYRIIQNLMDNALKYSLKGTRIYYSLEKADGRAVISVKNISSYEMTFTAEEILERFSRGDKSRSTEGSGLGLSIAQGFALACGGKLDIEIDGDMFKAVVSFPLAEAQAAEQKPSLEEKPEQPLPVPAEPKAPEAPVAQSAQPIAENAATADE